MPQPARTDEDIVRGVLAGEVRAAAALLDRYGPMVERLIRRVMGHDPDLEDLVQDAFTTILGSIHQVRDAEAIKLYGYPSIEQQASAAWLGLPPCSFSSLSSSTSSLRSSTFFLACLAATVPG